MNRAQTALNRGACRRRSACAQAVDLTPKLAVLLDQVIDHLVQVLNQLGSARTSTTSGAARSRARLGGSRASAGRAAPRGRTLFGHGVSSVNALSRRYLSAVSFAVYRPCKRLQSEDGSAKARRIGGDACTSYCRPDLSHAARAGCSRRARRDSRESVDCSAVPAPRLVRRPASRVFSLCSEVSCEPSQAATRAAAGAMPVTADLRPCRARSCAGFALRLT